MGGDDTGPLRFPSLPRQPAGAIEAESVAEVKASLIAALSKVDGGTVIRPMQAKAQGVLVGAHRFESGAILERAVRVGTDGIRRVDVVLWPGTPDAWTGLATRVVTSIEPREHHLPDWWNAFCKSPPHHEKN